MPLSRASQEALEEGQKDTEADSCKPWGRPRYHDKPHYYHEKARGEKKLGRRPPRAATEDAVDEQPVNLQLGEPAENERSYLADQRAKKDYGDEGSPPDGGGGTPIRGTPQ